MGRSNLRSGRPRIFPFFMDAADEHSHPHDCEDNAQHQSAQHKPGPLVARAIGRLILFVHTRDTISDFRAKGTNEKGTWSEAIELIP